MATIEVLLTFEAEDAEDWAWQLDALGPGVRWAKTLDVSGVPEDWEDPR